MQVVGNGNRLHCLSNSLAVFVVAALARGPLDTTLSFVMQEISPKACPIEPHVAAGSVPGCHMVRGPQTVTAAPGSCPCDRRTGFVSASAKSGGCADWSDEEPLTVELATIVSNAHFSDFVS
jgi:hypothetical protein